MALTHQGVFVQTPEIAIVSITNGNSTNKVTLFTSATSGAGTKIVGVTVVNVMTSNRIAHLYVAGTEVTSQTVLASAGNDGVTANTNMLGNWPLPKDNDGQSYLFLKPGNILAGSLTVAATTNKPAIFAVLGADF